MENQSNSIIKNPESIGLKRIILSNYFTYNCGDEYIYYRELNPSYSINKSLIIPKGRLWIFYLIVHKNISEKESSKRTKNWKYYTEVYRSFTQDESRYQVIPSSNYVDFVNQIPFNKCLKMKNNDPDDDHSKSNYCIQKAFLTTYTLYTNVCIFRGITGMRYFTGWLNADNRFYVMQLMIGQTF